MPSSSFGRVMGFAQLGSSLLYGTMRESVSRALGGSAQADRCAQAFPWTCLVLLLAPHCRA